MLEERSPFPLENRHPLLVGIAAGLIAGAVAGRTDKFMDRFISRRQKWRDKMVRKAPAHQMAGPHFGSKLLGRRLNAKEKKIASAAFGVLYGVGWGIIHGGLRKKFPQVSRFAGLPFAIPFFFACDGVLAPKLGVSPGLGRIPWQPNTKEAGNHIAWTAAAELVHRIAARVG